MKNFTCVQDIGNLKTALDEAFEIKKDRFKYVELGRNKTLMMIFFNSSLRTRLSTQKAALNLGMNVIVLDINQGAWKLETERGVIMDGDKPEHSARSYPRNGLLLRRNRCAFLRPLRRPRIRLQRSNTEPVYQILRPAGILHGSRHTPSAAKFCRPHYY